MGVLRPTLRIAELSDGSNYGFYYAIEPSFLTSRPPELMVLNERRDQPFIRDLLSAALRTSDCRCFGSAVS